MWSGFPFLEKGRFSFDFRLGYLYLCQMRTAGVVDVIYVNIVTWSMGCETVGELAKGGAVVDRPGARVDGFTPSRAKRLVYRRESNLAVSSSPVNCFFYHPKALNSSTSKQTTNSEPLRPGGRGVRFALGSGFEQSRRGVPLHEEKTPESFIFQF
jgi:hypothetical protein